MSKLKRLKLEQLNLENRVDGIIQRLIENKNNLEQNHMTDNEVYETAIKILSEAEQVKKELLYSHNKLDHIM